MLLQEILDRAASKTKTGTDYAAAKTLKRNITTFYAWRNGIRAPGADACMELAALTGVPLEEVINAAREARLIKKSKGKTGQLALSLVDRPASTPVTRSTSVQMPSNTPAKSTTSAPTSNQDGVYYVK